MGLVWYVVLPIGITIGILFGYLIRRYVAKRAINTAEARANALINEAKEKYRELTLSAKEKAIQVIDEAKRESDERRREIKDLQIRLEKRESLFDQKLLDLESRQKEIYERADKLEQIKVEIKKIREEQVAKLEKIANLNKDEAKKILLDSVENDIKSELIERIKKHEREAYDVIDEKAREMIVSAIQRCATSHSAETTTTSVQLPNDEMKGRIIGREGRNIKTLEQLTGVEIIVDDTPEVILISGFSPLRRHLAKRALDKLISDGRIHPGRIEETVEQAKKELAQDIRKAGEEAAYEVGIAGIDPKLIHIIGRLKYRTSYGQNILRHSIEVANLSAILAAELGANISLAKKAGFLHDIGKAVDQEVQGTHMEIGRDIARKFNIEEEVIRAIVDHHDDMPGTLEGVIVKVADAISGARPGARKDTYEEYVQRLTDLEQLAAGFQGVDRVYAIQAGREVRVFVVPDKIDDLAAVKLAKQIAGRIEEELKYPGEIKVNVIRESRVIEYAR